MPQHILWNGSVRVGSQATVERAIGEVGKKVRSKREPFANLANLIHEREMAKILRQLFPWLPTPASKKAPPRTIQTFSRAKIEKREEVDGTSFSDQLMVLRLAVGVEIEIQDLQRWGKIFFPGETAALHSVLSESRGKERTRSTRFFEVRSPRLCSNK